MSSGPYRADPRALTAEDEYGARTTLEVTLTASTTPITSATAATSPGETTRPSETGERSVIPTTARPGPGFGGAAAVVALGTQAVLSVLRRFLARV